MSRDYKKPEPKGRTGAMVLGIFVGLVLGLIAALAIAFYLNRAANPFAARDKPAATTAPAKGAPGTAVTPPGTSGTWAAGTSTSGTSTSGNSTSGTGTAADPGKTGTEGKPRFDFYTILPGVEQTATEQDLRNRKADAKSPVQERFFLQAGAFQNAQDADNLKARLALLGLEAIIQTANLGDKGIWHRVRLGPFDDADTLTRVRSQLAGSGIEAAPIKVRDKSPQ